MVRLRHRSGLVPGHHLPAVALAILLAVGLIPSAASASGLPRLDYGGRVGMRPAVFDGWAADGSLLMGGHSDDPPLGDEPGGSFGHIRWSVWNHRRAVGRGVVWNNDCSPSCGDGHWHAAPPTRVVAYRVRAGLFTRLVAHVAYAGPRRRIVFAYMGDVVPSWSPVSQLQGGQ